MFSALKVHSGPLAACLKTRMLQYTVKLYRELEADINCHNILIYMF